MNPNNHCEKRKLANDRKRTKQLQTIANFAKNTSIDKDYQLKLFTGLYMRVHALY